jgi:hypothetical protein
LWLPGEGFYAAIYFVKTAMRIEPTDYPRDVTSHPGDSQWVQFASLSSQSKWQHKSPLQAATMSLETIANSSNVLEEHALSELMILCVFDMTQTKQLPLMILEGVHDELDPICVESRSQHQWKLLCLGHVKNAH